MRRLAIALFVALIALVGSVSTSSADDPPPPPIIIVDPPPIVPGADAMIRAADSREFIGEGIREPGQRIVQNITQFERAVSIVRVCRVGSTQRIRVHGTGGSVNWKVRYRVRDHNVTRSIVAGTYHTRRLSGGHCTRITVTARLKPDGASTGRRFRIKAIPRSGESDAVATRVHIVGPIAVP